MSAIPSSSEHHALAEAVQPSAEAELFIVMNQGSGKSAKDEVRTIIEDELRRAGRAHRFVPVASGEIVQACQEAARLAKGQGGILVAAGGDGTINCAAQAAFTHQCPLGLIPQGTFNLFARDLGVSLEPGEATRMLLRAQAEPVQVGLVNERVFLVNGSLGLYPKLLADREDAKQKLGRRRWIAMLAALKSLLEWRAQLVLDAEIDGEPARLRLASIFLGNNRVQLARVGVQEDVVQQVGSGRLACMLVPPLAWWAKLRMLAAAAFGAIEERSAVDSIAVRSLTVSARNARKLKVATDGEVLWMELPLRFTVAPRPLQVMLPPPEDRLPRK